MLSFTTPCPSVVQISHSNAHTFLQTKSTHAKIVRTHTHIPTHVYTSVSHYSRSPPILPSLRRANENGRKRTVRGACRAEPISANENTILSTYENLGAHRTSHMRWLGSFGCGGWSGGENVRLEGEVSRCVLKRIAQLWGWRLMRIH